MPDLGCEKARDRRRLPSPDVTFHLGEYRASCSPSPNFDDVWEFNIRGTKEVVTFCHEHQSLLVYAGSSLATAAELHRGSVDDEIVKTAHHAGHADSDKKRCSTAPRCGPSGRSGLCSLLAERRGRGRWAIR